VIRLIAAIDSRRGIANDTGIPWSLPGDTAYFHQKTTVGVIVMGWTTYNEFASPLHRRENAVLTTRSEPLRAGFRPVGSLDELAAEHPREDIWVIGGAAVYADTIREADELLLTQVVGDFHCTSSSRRTKMRFVWRLGVKTAEKQTPRTDSRRGSALTRSRRVSDRRSWRVHDAGETA
jgi:dihydrofolate reductase